ncbi:uncharacterized protein LOC115922659 [Strongylocentrotus purpuratus]|uniref:Apple domain-containing protein n=1 Tax=Strongylocentrotus purpuratus TaxID=7668 RepID=A0A7M7NKF4_STRPU|nr:uncharacterized protein LOC115922659 [Strongylocentrotus purpuratus]
MGEAVLSTPMEFSQLISPLVLENTTSVSKRSAVYRLVARDRALTDTHSSHPDVRSVIRCGHICFEDESCKFFTYIKRTRMCLLGQRSTTEIHHEAATFTC